MLPKKQRLTGKEIQYILRRGAKIYGNLFVFRVIAQYPWVRMHQWSVQIPVKLDKRATMRNMLKRQASTLLQDMFLWSDWSIPYAKIFIFVNKQALQDMKDVIASGEKTRIVDIWKKWCKHDFTLCMQRIWTVLSNNSKQWWQRGRRWSNRWRPGRHHLKKE